LPVPKAETYVIPPRLTAQINVEIVTWNAPELADVENFVGRAAFRQADVGAVAQAVVPGVVVALRCGLVFLPTKNGDVAVQIAVDVDGAVDADDVADVGFTEDGAPVRQDEIRLLENRRFRRICGRFHKHFTSVTYSCSKITWTVYYINASNEPTYFATAVSYARKMFIKLSPGHLRPM
jgi:hypothetical protein